MELIDILNEDGEKIGVEPRVDVHKKGLLHGAVHVVVYNSQGDILLQRRAYEKDNHGGMWDIIVGGHISSGETPEIAVLKELKEEYGLKINFNELDFIKTKRFTAKNPETGWHDDEFNHIYLLNYEGNPSDLVLQEEEVAEVAFYSTENLKEIISDPEQNHEFCPYIDYKYYDEVIGYVKEKLNL